MVIRYPPTAVAETRDLVHIEPNPTEFDAQCTPVRERFGPELLSVGTEPVGKDSVSWPDLADIL